MAILLCDVENIEIQPPTTLELVDRETKSSIINFEELFLTCAEDILCTKYERKKVLNIDIVRRNTDYYLEQKHIEPLHTLLEGGYEGSADRSKFLDTMLEIWENSDNFRTISSGVVKALESETLDKSELKIFPYHNNPLPVTNLREYYRFKLYELYLPVRNFLLNRYMSLDSSRLYKSDNPLEFYLEGKKVPKDIKVMVGNKLYKAEISYL